MIDGSGAAAPIQQTPPSAVLRPDRFSVADQIAVSLLWFALFANWLTMVPVIIPDQIALILGPDAAAKEGITPEELVDRNAAKFEADAGQERQHLPHDFGVADHAHQRFGNIQEGEGTEVPERFLVGNHLANQAAEQTCGRGCGHAETFVSHQCGDGDDGAAYGTDNASAE